MTCFRMKNGETLRKKCFREGISYGIISDILNRRGCDPEEAVEYYYKRKRIPKAYLKTGERVRDYCKRNNLPLKLVYTRKCVKKESYEESIAYYENKIKEGYRYG